MLERHQAELPDLSRHVALLPSAHAISRFRRALLGAAEAGGHAALLAPWCGTLPAWLNQQFIGTHAPLSDTERELLLLHALAAYPRLRERFGTWPLIDALLTLFDELNAHRLPAASVEELTALLAAGYGRGSAELEPLRGEAELVHTLWTAWNGHLLERGLLDAGLKHLAAFATTDELPPSHHIYMVGIADLTGAEAEWLRRQVSSGRATVVLQGRAGGTGYHPEAALTHCLELLNLPYPAAPPDPDPYTQLLDRIYADDTELAARARAFGAAMPKSPALNRLRVHEAVDFEHEARAVELAIRRWHAHGIADIALVTQDRKLARRVRALLERANLGLRDHAGWALSTTSAATVLMRWLDCIEQDFAYAPLLELLKSPFLTLGIERHELERLTGLFERDVIRSYNVTGGMRAYRQAIQAAATPLDRDTDGAARSLLALLDRLVHAAEPVQHRRTATPHSPRQHLAALQQSLDRLGLLTTLGQDAAGAQLLALLRTDLGLPQDIGPRLSWAEFRQWLLRRLERHRFRVPIRAPSVELLSPAEARGMRFDALIIAGCSRDYFPGALPSTPFFNDGTRRQLGLPSRLNRRNTALYDFRRLLQAAPRVLLTRHREQRGEVLMPSPWLERLLAFHRLAYGDALADNELAALLAAPQTELFRRDIAPPPPTRAPAPRLPRGHVPTVYTASSHQRLLDCPYQFYAADGLGLKPTETVREELEKSDYGRRVHRILEAFHIGVAGLPGPWKSGAIVSANQAQARALLHDIARVVLAYEADARLSARGWRHRWERFADDYLEWQRAREHHWRVEAGEQLLERAYTAGDVEITLRGRLDRIDRGTEGVAILDYKTGTTPDTDSVLAGENAQLPFYALLYREAVAEVSYVKFTPEGVETQSVSAVTIARLAQRCEDRLRALIHALAGEAKLPAWGDRDTCGYCRFEGVCRKEMWSDEAK
jgi:ATP-dependent helicase/nuclease subunit B